MKWLKVAFHWPLFLILDVFHPKGSTEKVKQGRLSSSPAQIPSKRQASDLNKFRQTLPVYKMADDIIETIANNKVCLIAGETGSGKTTQVRLLSQFVLL